MNKRRRTSDQSEGQSEVAQQILAHLIEHPRAQDTLEGILDWWLLEQQIKRRAAQVRQALLELVAQELVVESKSRDGRIHYRINRRKVAQVRALLEQSRQEQAQPEHIPTTTEES